MRRSWEAGHMGTRKVHHILREWTIWSGMATVCGYIWWSGGREGYKGRVGSKREGPYIHPNKENFII